MKNFASLLILCMLLISSASIAQPGALDSSFGINGKVTNKHIVGARAVALQKDGKIVVVAGDYLLAGFLVVRFHEDGTLDRTFGVNGRAMATFGSEYEGAQSIAIQADGKIIAGGYANFDDFALARFRQNGELDSSFGVNGKVVTPMVSGLDGCMSLAIEPDGKIVALGRTIVNGDHYEFALVRYRQNGEVDKNFGDKGKVITDFGQFAEAYSVTIQPDGKILGAGTTYIQDYDVALVQYHHDGRPDSSFGLNGKVVTNLGFDEEATSVVKMKNGKILVAAGSVYDQEKFVLLEYRSSGQLDSAFGDNGKVFTYFNDNHLSTRSFFAVEEGEKILAGGYAWNGSSDGFALAEYKHDGTMNQDFGTNGKVQTDFNRGDWATAVAIQKDGKIVIAGRTNYEDLALARYYGRDVSGSAKNQNDIFSDIQKHSNASSNIRLIPNPVKDMLRIEGLSGLSSNKTISILDTKGKLLQRVTTANASYSFNVKELSAGMYFIRLDEGAKITTLRFIKE